MIIGAGPAGLGAGLALARAGASVVLADRAPWVGGLCVTRTHQNLRYDLGGHIPFVTDEPRQLWLRDLLGDDLIWVPRPVSSWRNGLIRRGRYLDQRPHGTFPGNDAPCPDPPPDADAATVLTRLFGAPHVEGELRRYLEKIDGVPLERIPGTRPLGLMRDQAAPEGFWFPRQGIGQLMEAMAQSIRRAGGQILTQAPITAVDVAGGRARGVRLDGATLATDQIILSVPAVVGARLLDPAPDAAVCAGLRMRAVCLVYLTVERPQVTDQAWIQVDDPDVPAARIFEMPNWSRAMCPPGHTVLGMECYCAPSATDPIWSRSDAALADLCAQSLVDPLEWLSTPRQARLVEVIRLPAAYPAPDLAQRAAAEAPIRHLDAIPGIHLARGSAVIDAIRQGETCAAAVLGDGR